MHPRCCGREPSLGISWSSPATHSPWPCPSPSLSVWPSTSWTYPSPWPWQKTEVSSGMRRRLRLCKGSRGAPCRTKAPASAAAAIVPVLLTLAAASGASGAFPRHAEGTSWGTPPGVLPQPPQHSFRNFSEAGFVFYSSFRLSPTRFAVVGLGLTQGLTLEDTQSERASQTQGGTQAQGEATAGGVTQRTVDGGTPGEKGQGAEGAVDIKDREGAHTHFLCAWASPVTGRGGEAGAGSLSLAPGNLTLLSTHDSHGRAYELAVLFCDLTPANNSSSSSDISSRRRELQAPGATQTTEAGGGNREGPGAEHNGQGAGSGSGRGDGQLVVHLGPVRFVAYSEAHQEPPSEPPQSSLAFCGPPVHGDLEPLSIRQWLQYHLFLAGYSPVYLYNAGGYEGAVREQALEFERRGVLRVVDFRLQELYPSWYFAQAVAMHDCLFRNRDSAAWVAYGDFDEYLVVPFSPALSLGAFLSRYASRRPWVSYGSYIFARYCNGRSTPWGRVPGGEGEGPQARRRVEEGGAEGVGEFVGGQGQGGGKVAGGRELKGGAAGRTSEAGAGEGAGSGDASEERFAVEWMVLRQRDPYCVRSKRNPNPDLCLSVAGRRKFIVNPRMVELLAIHRVQEVSREAHFQPPLHLPPSKLHLGHFKGLTRQLRRAGCLRAAPQDLAHMGDLRQETMLVTDGSIAAVAAAVRACCAKSACPVPC